MARAQYFVVHHQGQWKISFDGKHYGPLRRAEGSDQGRSRNGSYLGEERPRRSGFGAGNGQ